MNRNHPYPAGEGVVPVGMGILLTIVTCGIYGLFWRYKQIQVVNAWIGEGRFSFGMLILLSILTCGIYSIYFDYIFSQSINNVQHHEGLLVNESLPLISVLLSVLGLGIVSMAIQQSDINAFFGERADY